ncbi:MAG: glycosyl transferase, group 1 [Thermomicrobiales bacterium]|nr:glycosyl transferase, group 1 [Thermomicrobiales bacterium]
MTLPVTTVRARERVRSLMSVEGDLAFRRRCETILEWLDPAPNSLILDCGCGYGFTLRMLAELTDARLVGVDGDAARIDRTQHDLRRFSQITTVTADALDLPFACATFHHAVCSEVLEHVVDDARVVQELARVLKPGGTLVVTVPSANFPFTWDPPNWVLKRLGGRQLGGERPWSGIWYGHLRLYDYDRLTDVLRAAGFEIIEQRPLTFRTPPFAHLLLYGIGKPLLQRGWVPSRLRMLAGRVDEANRPPGWLMQQAMRLLNAIDAPNDDPGRVARATSFVALAILARSAEGPSSESSRA